MLCRICAALLIGSAVAEEAGWQNGKGYRSIQLPAPTGGRTGFTLLSNTLLGLNFTNVLPVEKMLDNNNLLNGAGVATGDYDGDGQPDIFFPSLEGRPALFRNLGGWRFTNATESAGIGMKGMAGTGALFVDWNGDGKLDLVVMSCGGSNACLVNLGGGHFTNMTAQAGLSWRAGSTSVAAGDLNGDGWLDLYAANYGENTVRSGISLTTRMVNGQEVVTGRWANRIKIIAGKVIEFGEPDVVALNTGRGAFQMAPWKGGIFKGPDGKDLTAAPWDMGLSVTIRDLNGDGRPDIYVCNDFQTPDRIWLNEGRGGYAPMPEAALRCTPHFSMSVDVADVNGDGLMDIFVADMRRRSHASEMRQGAVEPEPVVPGEWETRPQVRQNMLFLNRGDGTYAEIAEFAGLAATDWTWCAAFLDVDLDGHEDLLIANGHGFDTEDKDTMLRLKAGGKQGFGASRTNLLAYPPLRPANLVFKNRGDLHFEEMGRTWGFNSKQVSHGLSFADLDGDGDLDVVVSCLNEPPLVYRNDTDAPRIAVRLKGRAPNVYGIGARITLRIGAVTQTREMAAGGHYLSGDAPERVFAARPAWVSETEAKGRLEVRWPGGKTSVIEPVEPNRRYEVDESGAETMAPVVVGAAPMVPPLFTEINPARGGNVPDEPFDDFARQPLLPRKLSMRGPPLLWLGAEDGKSGQLWAGGGNGGRITLLSSDGAAWRREEMTGPGTAALARCVWEGKPAVVAGASGYRLPDATGLPLTVFPVASLSNGIATTILATNLTCLVSGDFGFFVGEGSVPGAYPKPLGSRVYRTLADAKPDSADTATVAAAGVVNGAVAADMDGDGKLDLIAATEWGPVRVYLWRADHLEEATERLGLGGFKGWWNAVVAADFDGDGRMDLAAANWGSNTRWQARRTKTLRLYAGDFDGSGTMQIVEAYFDPETNQFVPEHGLGVLGKFWPEIAQRFPTYASLAGAGVEELLGGHLKSALLVEANWLESTVFLNRGERFEARVLPPEAQFAPVFGMAAGDFDGDGHADLALAQNFSGVPATAPRMQAGRGLVLLGDGRGGFKAQSSARSGMVVDGDGRACVAGDFDGDGRLDLAMSQWNGALKIWKNTGGGLRK